MAVDSINNSWGYGSAQNTIKEAGLEKTIKKVNPNDTGVSVDSFLQLLAAQLQNQDMMNPMKDSDFMQQIASFTSLQAMQNVDQSVQITNQISSTAYSLSLVGKEVVAAGLDSKGELVKTEGVVTGVSLYQGQPVFYIGDKGFYISQLMSVGKVPVKPEGGTDGAGGSDDKDQTGGTNGTEGGSKD